MMKPTLLITLSSLSLAACGSKGTTTPSMAQRPTATTADLIALMPANADVVFGVDVAKLRSSALVKPYLDQALAGVEGTPFAACAKSLPESFGTVVLGLVRPAGGKEQFRMVANGVNRANIAACLESAKNMPDRDGKMVITGDTVVFEKDGDTMLMRYMGDSALAIAFDDNAALQPAMLDGWLADASGGFGASPAFKDVMPLVRTTDAMWFAVGPVLLKDAGLPQPPAAAVGSVDVTTGVALNMRMRFAAATDAQAFNDQAGPMIGQMKMMGMASEAASKVDGADTVFDVSMTEAQMHQIAGMMMPMLGNMGGGEHDGHDHGDEDGEGKWEMGEGE